MSIADEQVEQIRERVSIVDVVGESVPLRQNGDRFTGLCPFHGEKTPSFSVSASKGMYYCFGCHAGGDVFSFVMRRYAMGFVDAVKLLAQRAGVALEPETPEARERARSEHQQLHALQQLQSFFVARLWDKTSKTAHDYIRQRGIPRDQVRTWGLGYGGSPAELSAFYKHDPALMRVMESYDVFNNIDLFAERLIFPIKDPSFRLVGFGARRIGDPDAPKYVNSKESLVFCKRRLLYGWEQAQSAIGRSQRVVLVEGYTDVLACHQAGCAQAVAALGTAFTDEHAVLCSRVAKDLVLFLDADSAGARGTREAALAGMRAGLRVSVAALPVGEDPDSIVRSNREDVLREALASPRPAIEHFIDTAFADVAMGIQAKVAAASDLAPFIHALPTGLERDLVCRTLAERVGVTSEELSRHLKMNRPVASVSKQPAAVGAQLAVPCAPTVSVSDGLDKTELDMLRELLLFPNLRSRFAELAPYAISKRGAMALRLMSDPNADLAVIFPDHIDSAHEVRRLLAISPAISDHPQELEQRAEATFTGVLKHMQARHLQREMAELHAEITACEARGEDTLILVQRWKEISRTKADLNRRTTIPIINN